MTKLIAFVSRILGWFLGVLWFDVLRIRRQVALENLRRAFPEWSEKRRRQVARSSVYNLTRNIFEYAIFPFLTQKNIDRHLVLQGEENLLQALSQKKGALILGIHLGNGDLAIGGYSLIGRAVVTVISKEFRSRWLNDLWFGMRRRLGTKFISPERSSFEILRALKRNEMVVFVLDQFMGPPIGVRTRFFGHETGTAAGLALMALRTEAPVIPTYTYRRADGISVLVYEKAISHLDHGPKAENISVMTQVYTDKLEEIIRKHPEQWMWIHRRWKEFRE